MHNEQTPLALLLVHQELQLLPNPNKWEMHWIDRSRICELWHVIMLQTNVRREIYVNCDIYGMGYYIRAWLKCSRNYSGITHTFKRVICPSISHPFDYLQAWKNILLKSFFIYTSAFIKWFVTSFFWECIWIENLSCWKQCAVLSPNNSTRREYLYSRLFCTYYIRSSYFDYDSAFSPYKQSRRMA